MDAFKGRRALIEERDAACKQRDAAMQALEDCKRETPAERKLRLGLSSGMTADEMETVIKAARRIVGQPLFGEDDADYATRLCREALTIAFSVKGARA